MTPDTAALRALRPLLIGGVEVVVIHRDVRDALCDAADEVVKVRDACDRAIASAERRAAAPHLLAAHEAEVRARVAAEIRAMRSVCPTHGYPDCSPLLNGCSFPMRWVEREDAARIANPTTTEADA